MIATDWTLTAAQMIAKQVLRDGDRSDLVRIQKILTELCPFKQGVNYVEVPKRVKV